MTSILVDRRTGSKDLHTLLPKGYSELTELEFADAVVVGNGPDGVVTEAFERKQLDDALSCIQDNRFAAHQILGCREHYDFVWLVIEAETRAHPRTGVLQKAIDRKPLFRKRGGRTVVVGEEIHWVDAISGDRRQIMWRDYKHWLLSMRRGMEEEIDGVLYTVWVDDIVETTDARGTAALIYNTYTWRQKRWSDHKSFKAFNTSQDAVYACGACGHSKSAHAHGRCVRCNTPCDLKKKRPVRVFRPPNVAKFASCFDGVGYDRALSLAEHFKSPEEFVAASMTELTKVPGIGRKLAESIVRQRSARR